MKLIFYMIFKNSPCQYICQKLKLWVSIQWGWKFKTCNVSIVLRVYHIYFITPNNRQQLQNVHKIRKAFDAFRHEGGKRSKVFLRATISNFTIWKSREYLFSDKTTIQATLWLCVNNIFGRYIFFDPRKDNFSRSHVCLNKPLETRNIPSQTAHNIIECLIENIFPYEI